MKKGLTPKDLLNKNFVKIIIPLLTPFVLYFLVYIFINSFPETKNEILLFLMMLLMMFLFLYGAFFSSSIALMLLTRKDKPKKVLAISVTLQLLLVVALALFGIEGVFTDSYVCAKYNQEIQQLVRDVTLFCTIKHIGFHFQLIFSNIGLGLVPFITFITMPVAASYLRTKNKLKKHRKK